jgi:hypothetical protein
MDACQIFLVYACGAAAVFVLLSVRCAVWYDRTGTEWDDRDLTGICLVSIFWGPAFLALFLWIAHLGLRQTARWWWTRR